MRVKYRVDGGVKFESREKVVINDWAKCGVREGEFQVRYALTT